MHSVFSSVLALAGAFAPTLLSAQQPLSAPTTPQPQFAWPAAVVLAEATAHGVVSAAAPGWKAEFGPAGATFTPFLGSEVPSSPARFRLSSIHAGGTELRLADAAPRLQDRRVTYERGAVTEFFDLGEAGIEHQFLFSSLPNRDTLRLRVEVATKHPATRDGAGFLFAGPAGGVRYGAAVAIDANGRRTALATEWADGGLHIVVPPTFLAAASLPLLVDPMIGGSAPFPATAAEQSGTDIAFDASLGRYYATFERAFSATDHDVFVVMFDQDMAPLTTLTIDYSSQYWSKPRIATLEAHDVACVVAETSAANASPFSTSLRRITGGLAPVVQPVMHMSGLIDYRDPSIGGDADPNGPSEFLLGWTIEDSGNSAADIRLMNLMPNGSVSYSTSLVLPATIERKVAISKTCGDRAGGTDSWALVFRSETPGQATGALKAAIVDRLGPTLRWFQGQPCFPLTGTTMNFGTGWSVSSPTDHANGRRFLCAERSYNLVALRGSVYGHVFDHDANVLAANVPLRTGSLDYRQPVVDSDGARFALAVSAHLSSSDADLYCTTHAFVDNQVVTHDLAAVSYSGDYDHAASLCASRLAGRNRYGLSFVRRNGNYAVHGQLYRGAAASGSSTRSTGCGNLGIAPLGTPGIGELFQVQLSSSAGFPGFVVGAPVSTPIGPCAGCLQGASGTTLLGDTLAIAIPHDPALVGLVLSAQGFRFAFGGLPCLGQVEFSNTLDFAVQ